MPLIFINVASRYCQIILKIMNDAMYMKTSEKKDEIVEMKPQLNANVFLNT